MLEPRDVDKLAKRVWPVAEAAGLEPPHVHFELVSAATIAGLASYQGMPVRYAHWSFGKSYQHLKTAHDYRLTQIYELVINSEPTYAFLDVNSTPSQALMIIAHVLAHADFFGHNRLFARVPRDMVNRMAFHRREMNAWRQQYGDTPVETLIDAARILMDFVGGGRERRTEPSLDDVMGYVIDHAPHLRDWERLCLSYLYDEARYFWPQQLSKVANEGYATFWHTRIVRQVADSAEEAWETARLNAQVVAVAPPQLNPYRLGYLLYDRIFAHGGLPALFEARDVYDDSGLVRAWFDETMAEPSGLAVFRERDGHPRPRPTSGKDVKAQLQRDLDHAGIPRIRVMPDRTHKDQLYLFHLHDGRDLDFAKLPYALGALAERIWQGPITLNTSRQRVQREITHDGVHYVDDAI